MTFKLSKQFRFEASHQLPHHDGKCARLHGHSWVGWAHAEGTAIRRDGPKQGMVVDYGDMGSAIKEMVERHLDHWHLNTSLGMESPTSELVAGWCLEWLRRKAPSINWTGVTIEETCTSRCELHDPPTGIMPAGNIL